jgi:hypothetical protein
MQSTYVFYTKIAILIIKKHNPNSDVLHFFTLSLFDLFAN